MKFREMATEVGRVRLAEPESAQIRETDAAEDETCPSQGQDFNVRSPSSGDMEDAPGREAYYELNESQTQKIGRKRGHLRTHDRFSISVPVEDPGGGGQKENDRQSLWSGEKERAHEKDRQ